MQNGGVSAHPWHLGPFSQLEKAVVLQKTVEREYGIKQAELALTQAKRDLALEVNKLATKADWSVEETRAYLDMRVTAPTRRVSI